MKKIWETNNPTHNLTLTGAREVMLALDSLGITNYGLFVDTDTNAPVQDRYLTVDELIAAGFDPDWDNATFVVRTKQPLSEEYAGEYRNLGLIVETVRKSANSTTAVSRIMAEMNPGQTASVVAQRIADIPAVSNAVEKELTRIIASLL